MEEEGLVKAFRAWDWDGCATSPKAGDGLATSGVAASPKAGDGLATSEFCFCVVIFAVSESSR